MARFHQSLQSTFFIIVVVIRNIVTMTKFDLTLYSVYIMPPIGVNI